MASQQVQNLMQQLIKMSQQDGKPGKWGKQSQNPMTQPPNRQTRKSCQYKLGLSSFWFLQLWALHAAGREDAKSNPKAGGPPTKSGQNNNSTKAGEPLREQMLHKQIREAKDDPEMTELLETALKKVLSYKRQAAEGSARMQIVPEQRVRLAKVGAKENTADLGTNFFDGALIDR
eukprot:6480916-Amphidinium_carterae.1